MRIEASTIDELFAGAGEREDDLRRIDQIIRTAAPQLERRLFAGPSITMVGYGQMTWTRSSDTGVWPVIGLTAQKRHIAMYVAASKDGETLAEHYRTKLGKTDNGKGCIRFRRLDDVDVEVLADAVRDAASWAEHEEERFGRARTEPVDDG